MQDNIKAIIIIGHHKLKSNDLLYQYKEEFLTKNIFLHIKSEDLIDIHTHASETVHLNITRRGSDSLLTKRLKRSKTTDDYIKSFIIVKYNQHHYHINYINNLKKYDVFIIHKNHLRGELDHLVSIDKLNDYHIKSILIGERYDVIYKSIMTDSIYISCKAMMIGDFIKILPLLFSLL